MNHEVNLHLLHEHNMHMHMDGKSPLANVTGGKLPTY